MVVSRHAFTKPQRSSPLRLELSKNSHAQIIFSANWNCKLETGIVNLIYRSMTPHSSPTSLNHRQRAEVVNNFENLQQFSSSFSRLFLLIRAGVWQSWHLARFLPIRPSPCPRTVLPQACRVSIKPKQSLATDGAQLQPRPISYLSQVAQAVPVENNSVMWIKSKLCHMQINSAMRNNSVMGKNSVMYGR